MSRRLQPRRILIIRPSALGDVCRTVPVLASVRRAFEAAEIDWIVQDGFADAIAAHPALNRVIPFPRGRFARWWRRPAVAAEAWRWIGALRRHRYDLVLDCQGLGRSGFMCFVTGAPRRIGPRHARELGWLGYSVRHAVDPALHTVDQMLALLEPAGVPAVPDMRLYVPPQALSQWAGMRERIGLADRPYVVLAPTSRWPSKRWPADCWQALIEALGERGDAGIVLIGAPGEQDQVARILHDLPTRTQPPADLAGHTSVGQTMAVISGADLLVANDSAPLHMAVGLDRPCVGLFGPTDPKRVGPYRRDESVVRAEPVPGETSVSFKSRALGDQLMRRIQVQEVLDAAERALEGRAAGAPRTERSGESIGDHCGALRAGTSGPLEEAAP